MTPGELKPGDVPRDSEGFPVCRSCGWRDVTIDEDADSGGAGRRHQAHLEQARHGRRRRDLGRDGKADKT